MSDESEILSLLEGYAEAVDGRDPDMFVELFTHDAVIVSPEGHEISGRERLHKLIAETPGRGEHNPEPPHKLEIEGHRAVAESRFSAITRDGTNATGDYIDALFRTPAGWRISRREIRMD